jgi:acetyl esterase
MGKDLLDPQIKDFLNYVEEVNSPALNTMRPAQAREAYTQGIFAVRGDLIPVGSIHDELIDGPSGPIGMRVYQPGDHQGLVNPVLVYFHGGGWSFGSIETHDHICRRICSESACIIVSVDYHLAPEYKFPVAVDDAIFAVNWVAANGARLCADVSRIAVGGDSAGATLATVAAMAARDTGYPDISYQLLIYPATDMSMGFPSHRKFGEGFRLTRPLMVWSTTNYLGDGQDILDPRASPLLAQNHASLPPALIITAGFDPLQDEAIAYAEKLKIAGVAVEHWHLEGMIHGFIGMTGIVDQSVLALEQIGQALKEALR